MGTRPDGRTDRKHIRRSTKAELDRAVRQLERSRDNGQYTWTEADPTLGQWLDHWLETILPMTARWKTLSTYRSLMRVHVIPAMGPVRLSRIQPETLEQHYRALMQAGKSAHVVHAVHRVLRSALSEAKRRQRIITNPAAIARPPRVESIEVQPLTADECKAILGAAATSRNAARWSVAVALGLRQGEALGLTWTDVDLAAGTIRIRRAVQRWTWQHGCRPSAVDPTDPPCGRRRGADCPQRKGGGIRLVQPKTSASCRTVVLPGQLVDELRVHRVAQARERLEAGSLWNHAQDMVFATPTGMLIDPARDNRDWTKLLTRAQVRAVRLHDARHTAATLLLVQGVDLRTVMSIMGWTEMATAQRYAHAVDELRQEAARRMGSALWSDTTQPSRPGNLAPPGTG